jgi:hypothetical protein
MTNAGNALQVLLPLAAYASTVYMDDWDGAKQYSKALAVNMLTVEVLKKTTREWRPDHSNQLSFPSGHAAAAFSAGAFVRQRYGVAYALPLYTLGAYTAYSRVQAKKHYWHDVAGSLVVAELSQHIFSTPHEKTKLNVALTGGLGAQLTINHNW